MNPFALHVTWTCYATWLPGDKRGYVSNTRLPKGGFVPKANTPGTPYTSDDPFTRGLSRAEQLHPTVRLTLEQAVFVASTLIDAVAERDWFIIRAAIIANHTHVLVTRCPHDGPTVRRVLKGVTQAALSDLAGQRRKWWTAGGSDRYKHDQRAIDAADGYIARQAGILAGIANMKLIVCG
jgi:hypothetical protein